jgi:hypothetical protein
MLTAIQIDIITMVSWAVWFGLVAGAVGGAFVGAFVWPIRTHRFSSFLAGAFSAALPGAAVAIAVSLVAAVLQMVLCTRGHKTGWDVPMWAMSIHTIAVCVAGVIGAMFAQRPSRAPLRRRTIIVWVFVGAFLGALAPLRTSFDGYYVFQSNARPICNAVAGFVIGGIIVLLWRAAFEMLQTRSRHEHAGGGGTDASD